MCVGVDFPSIWTCTWNPNSATCKVCLQVTNWTFPRPSLVQISDMTSEPLVNHQKKRAALQYPWQMFISRNPVKRLDGSSMYWNRRKCVSWLILRTFLWMNNFKFLFQISSSFKDYFSLRWVIKMPVYFSEITRSSLFVLESSPNRAGNKRKTQIDRPKADQKLVENFFNFKTSQSLPSP